MSYRKLLVILSGIWLGLGFVLLSTYAEWKQVSEYISMIMGCIGFVIAVYDFITRRM